MRDQFTVEDLVKLLPFENLLVVAALSGEQLLAALENSVSMWPKKEGRFMQAPAPPVRRNPPQSAGRAPPPLSAGARVQVSNLKFAFDGGAPSGARVDRGSVLVGGEALDPGREYSVAVLDITAAGKEGYDVFTEARVLRDSEVNSDLKTLVRNHFCLRGAAAKLQMLMKRRSSLGSTKARAAAQPGPPPLLLPARPGPLRRRPGAGRRRRRCGGPRRPRLGGTSPG